MHSQGIEHQHDSDIVNPHQPNHIDYRGVGQNFAVMRLHYATDHCASGRSSPHLPLRGFPEKAFPHARLLNHGDRRVFSRESELSYSDRGAVAGRISISLHNMHAHATAAENWKGTDSADNARAGQA